MEPLKVHLLTKKKSNIFSTHIMPPARPNLASSPKIYAHFLSNFHCGRTSRARLCSEQPSAACSRRSVSRRNQNKVLALGAEMRLLASRSRVQRVTNHPQDARKCLWCNHSEVAALSPSQKPLLFFHTRSIPKRSGNSPQETPPIQNKKTTNSSKLQVSAAYNGAAPYLKQRKYLHIQTKKSHHTFRDSFYQQYS